MKISIKKGSRLQRLRKYFKEKGYTVKFVSCHKGKTYHRNERQVVFLDNKHKTHFELKYEKEEEFIYQFTKDTGIPCFYVSNEGKYSCQMDIDHLQISYSRSKYLGPKPKGI